MFGQLSGSMGNTTASHNSGGSYLRNRVIPVNPNTPAQSAIRTQFTSFSQNWRDLTQAEQNGWIQLAILDPTTDTQGNAITLSGQAYYVGFNSQRAAVGLARLDVAPAMTEVPPAVLSAVNLFSGGGGTMDYSPTVDGGTIGNFQLIQMTAPLSNGINFVGRSLYKQITNLAGNDPVVPPEDLATAYELVHGAGWQASIGMKIGLRVVGCSDSGFSGDATTFLVPITA